MVFSGYVQTLTKLKVGRMLASMTRSVGLCGCSAVTLTALHSCYIYCGDYNIINSLFTYTNLQLAWHKLLNQKRTKLWLHSPTESRLCKWNMAHVCWASSTQLFTLMHLHLPYRFMLALTNVRVTPLLTLDAETFLSYLWMYLIIYEWQRFQRATTLDSQQMYHHHQQTYTKSCNNRNSQMCALDYFCLQDFVDLFAIGSYRLPIGLVM